MDVHHINLDAFLSAQLRLVHTFHTAYADVVARIVISVFFSCVGVNLAHISEDVRGNIVRIDAQASCLGVKAFEFVQILLKGTILLGRNLFQENRRFVI